MMAPVRWLFQQFGEGLHAMAQSSWAFLVTLVFIAIIGGATFLATWEIPAPMSPVEKVIPDDRFSR